jgi:hypothetical protein
VLLSDFSKQFTLPACFGLCAKVLVRTQICFSSSSHLALVRFSQLLRFQLFFFLCNIFFGSTSSSSRFIHRSRKIFPPALRSAVCGFFLQLFGLRCPFSLQKNFVSAEGSFLPVIPSVGVLGVLSRSAARPSARQGALAPFFHAWLWSVHRALMDLVLSHAAFSAIIHRAFDLSLGAPVRRFTFRVLCAGLFFAPLRFMVPAHRPILLLSLTAW